MNRSKFSIGLVVTLLLITILFSQEREQHYHQVVECQYANGHKSYGAVFCHTEQAQVTKSGNHLYNIRADKFFNGELSQCK